MTRLFAPLLLLTAACLLGGCGFFSSVRVETARVAATPPGNVSIYLSVEQSGEPIDYLDDGNFAIYENDVRLSSEEIGLRLLPRDSIADGHTVLLLDLSGNPSPDFLARLARGAAHFVEKVTVTQAVTVLTFDGSAKVQRVASFGRVATPTERALPSLTAFASGDSSRDLYGAVLEALTVLDRELQKSSKAVQLGTLVVHAQGPDLAGRKSEREILAALEGSPREHYAITEAEAEIAVIGSLGDDAIFRYASSDELPLRFQDLGMRVRKAWGRHYLLSYCSPSRAGKREVTTVVSYTDAEGGVRTGKGQAEFSADGFGAGCKPSPVARASFVETEPAPTEPPPQPEPTPDPSESQVAPKPTPKKKAPSPPSKKTNDPKPVPSQPTEDVVAPPTSGKYK